jgi:hypothetical protein
MLIAEFEVVWFASTVTKLSDCTGLKKAVAGLQVVHD